MDLSFNSIDELRSKFSEFNVAWYKLVELNEFDLNIFRKTTYVKESKLNYDNNIINFNIGDKSYLYYSNKYQGVKDFIYMCISNIDVQLYNCYYGNWGCVLEMTELSNCLSDLILSGLTNSKHITSLLDAFTKTNKNIVHLNFSIYNIYCDKAGFYFLDYRFAGKMNEKIKDIDDNSYIKDDKSDLASVIIVIIQAIGSYYKYPALILLNLNRRNITSKFLEIMRSIKSGKDPLIQQNKIDLFEAIHLVLFDKVLYKKITHPSVPLLKFYVVFIYFCIEQEYIDEDEIPLQLRMMLQRRVLNNVEIQSKHKGNMFELLETMLTSGNDVLEAIGKLIFEVFQKFNIKRN